MPRLLALLLVLCVPLGAASNPQSWKLPLQNQGFQDFDRNSDAFWMNQQGILFLPPDRVVVYQVKRSPAPAKLGPRDLSGGTGNFTLSIKALSVEDGRFIKSLELPTSGTVSSVMATRGGGFLVRAGSALYLYSKDFTSVASRVLRTERQQDDAERWQVKVTPSGGEVVLLHEQDASTAGAADKDAVTDAEERTPGIVEILDAGTLQVKKKFTLRNIPGFWTPADDLLLSSNPANSQSDRPVGMLDFEGKWSSMPAEVERAKNSCRASVRAIDQRRIVVYGCDAFSVFSPDGKRLFSRNDQRFIFRSIASGGSYLAAVCDHYRLASDTPDGDAYPTTRPDRIEVYDLARNSRMLSFRVHSLRVYYAISPEGDLAVIDGGRLEMVRARR
jgi:hypothetical protein